MPDDNLYGKLNLEYVQMKMIPGADFSHQKLISVTNGKNSEKKICEAFLYKQAGAELCQAQDKLC